MNIEQEIETDIERLEKNSWELQKEILQTMMDLRRLRKQVDMFLERYYEEVLVLFIHMQELKQSTEEKSMESFWFPPAAGNKKEEQAYYKTEMQALYRKLVKKCHPDVREKEHSSHKVFQELHQAYQSEDYATLLYLEQCLEEHSVTEEETLEEKWTRFYNGYEALRKKKIYLQQEESEFQASASFQLYQKALWSRISGGDLIQQVKADLEEKIQELLLKK